MFFAPVRCYTIVTENPNTFLGNAGIDGNDDDGAVADEIPFVLLSAEPPCGFSPDPEKLATLARTRFNILAEMDYLAGQAQADMQHWSAIRLWAISDKINRVVEFPAASTFSLSRAVSMKLVVEHIVIVRRMLSAQTDDAPWIVGIEGIFDHVCSEFNRSPLRALQIMLAQLVLYCGTDMGLCLFVLDTATVLGQHADKSDVRHNFHETMAYVQKGWCTRGDCTRQMVLSEANFPSLEENPTARRLSTLARLGSHGCALKALDAELMGLPEDVIPVATGPCPFQYLFSITSRMVWAVLCRYGMVEHGHCKIQQDRVVMLVGGDFCKADIEPDSDPI
ncbi:hypothetical protein JCM10207_001243 [Rhodosporidiobolus poonsookiae]